MDSLNNCECCARHSEANVAKLEQAVAQLSASVKEAVRHLQDYADSCECGNGTHLRCKNCDNARDYIARHAPAAAKGKGE